MSSKPRKYVVDFDDLCDNVYPTLEQLEALKIKYPTFRCTLFTIPTKTSPKLLNILLDYSEWIKLAPHGWWHTRGECLGWTSEEATLKIQAAGEMGIDAPVFRAPGWLLDSSVYEACKGLDYVVASHKDHRYPMDGVREYVYNDSRGKTHRTRGVHGHLSNVSGNYIVDMMEDGRLKFPDNAEFVYPWEAAV